MTFENLNGLHPFTAVAGSTGMGQYTAVVVTGTGTGGPVVGRPAAGAPITGVIRSEGSTKSTQDNQAVSLYPIGTIAIIKANAASTVGIGDLVSVSTSGRLTAVAAGHYAIGHVVGGTSGAENRLMSVHLTQVGTT